MAKYSEEELERIIKLVVDLAKDPKRNEKNAWEVYNSLLKDPELLSAIGQRALRDYSIYDDYSIYEFYRAGFDLGFYSFIVIDTPFRVVEVYDLAIGKVIGNIPADLWRVWKLSNARVYPASFDNTLYKGAYWVRYDDMKEKELTIEDIVSHAKQNAIDGEYISMLNESIQTLCKVAEVFHYQDNAEEVLATSEAIVALRDRLVDLLDARRHEDS